MFDRLDVSPHMRRSHPYFSGPRVFVCELHYRKRLTLLQMVYVCGGNGGRLLLQKLTAKEVRFTVLEVARETYGIFETRQYMGTLYV